MKKLYLLLSLFLCLGLFGCEKSDTLNVLEQDPNKTYQSKDPQECKAMMVQCEAGERGFFDETGCGCEKKSKVGKFE